MRRATALLAVAATLVAGLLAGFAEAQDAPATSAAPATDPPPWEIGLPPRTTHAGEAPAPDAPTQLLAAGGFVVAVRDPRPVLRAEGGHLWRVDATGESPAALRVANDTPDAELAAIDDATARRLLALDLDVLRPDAEVWLRRIDPIRCAVRLRLGEGARLPDMPAGLELLEATIESGVRILGARDLTDFPALPRLRRLAVYGYAVSDSAVAAFRRELPAAVLTCSLADAFDEATRGCAACWATSTGPRRPRPGSPRRRRSSRWAMPTSSRSSGGAVTSRTTRSRSRASMRSCAARSSRLRRSFRSRTRRSSAATAA